MTKRFSGTIYGLLFSIPGLLVYLIPVFPEMAAIAALMMLTTIPLAIPLELLGSSIFTVYGHTYLLSVIILTVIFLIASMIYYKSFNNRIATKRPFSTTSLNLYYLALLFIIHPLVFDIWAFMYSESSGGGQFDAWAWRLNSSLEPQWGSLIGGEGDELEYRAPASFVPEIIRHEPNVAISDNDLVFINGFTTAPNSGSANEFPYTMGTGMYNQYGNNDAVNSNYDKSDAFLVGLDGNNDAIWSTYFGGSGYGASNDNANVGDAGDAGDAITVQGNKIYIVGRSFSTEDFPHECPTGAYCNNNPSGVVNQDHSTAYIAQVNEKLWILSNETVEKYLEANLSVYPNPFTERVYVQLTEGSSKVNYSLLDIAGKLVAKGTVNQNQGIDFSQLNAGAYLLQIEGEQTQTFKVIKQ